MPRTASRPIRLPKALQPTPTALTMSPESPSGRYSISVTRSTLPSAASLDQGEVAHTDRVVLEGLVEHGAETLPHRTPPRVRRPHVVVGDRCRLVELLDGDGVQPRLELGGLLLAHREHLVERRVGGQVEPLL